MQEASKIKDNVRNLKKGQVIKNYKELCNILGLKIKSGKSKVIQLKDIERYIKYTKDKHKFKILDVYNIPKAPVLKRSRKNYVNFRVSKENENKGGIYKIQLDNKVYIGQTNNFRKRYRQHFNKRDNCNSKKIIDKGIFTIIELSDDLEYRLVIENTITKLFLKAGFEVLNNLNVLYDKKKHWEKVNKKHDRYIKIKDVNYQDAIKLLIKNELI